MKRRQLLVNGAFAGIALATGCATGVPLNHESIKTIDAAMADNEVGSILLSRLLSVDTHAHPGRSFVANAENLSNGAKQMAAAGTFEPRAIADMKAGGLTASTFAAVSDYQVLTIGAAGISAGRQFFKGEAWQSFERQLEQLRKITTNEDVILVGDTADIHRAKQTKRLGVILTAEGGDFLEGSLDKLDQVYAAGLRSITIVHYRVNAIGDIQTAPAVHGGLTDFGVSVVKAMNSKGMLIDLAHASSDTVDAVLAVSEAPVMISHTAVRRAGFDSPRFIDRSQALKVAEAGGVIGVWPAGIGLTNLSQFCDQVLRTIDDIGIDSVVLGTDMDANYKPVFDNYRQLPEFVGRLYRLGLREDELGKFLASNYMRVFGG